MESEMRALLALAEADDEEGLAAALNDPNIADESGETLLLAAAAANARRVASFLLGKGADVNRAGRPAHVTPLMRAAYRGHLQMCSLLLDGRAQINALTTSGESALHLALREGHDDCGLLLLDAGANSVAVSEYGHTPLMRAVEGRAARCFDRLIDVSDLLAVESRGRSALHIACMRGAQAPQWVEKLLIRGAAIDAWDSDGRTALHRAAERGAVDVVRLLLVRGADETIVDKNGETALVLAMECHESECADILSTWSER